MPSRFDPNIIQKALISPRWAGQVRLDASPAAIARWDKTLVRDTRVLVPIDVQALYVPAGDTTPYVRLPFALTTPDGQPPETMPDPFDKGKPRTPGVHLHWMPPDHLLKGALTNVDDGSRNRLGMPALPDRWVVIRIAAPIGGATVLVKGWVIEADTAKVIPLENWPAGSAAAAPEGKTVAREDLTGTVGGHVNWVAGYDGVKNRLAFYDPLTDLPTAAPQGVTDDLATYVVAGWWSDPKLDPLDGADTASSLHVRLHEIGHRLVTDAEGADQALQDRKLKAARRDTLGLASGSRYGTSIALKAASPVQDALLTAKAYSPLASKLAENAAAVVAAEPRQPRLSLLHGSVHGVPVRGPVIADLRPDPSGIDLALGRHVDDLAAVLAAVNLPDGAAPAKRRALERLLSAFTGQVLSKLGTPDGAVAADEHEHEAGFASRSGGQGAVERLRTGAEDGTSQCRTRRPRRTIPAAQRRQDRPRREDDQDARPAQGPAQGHGGGPARGDGTLHRRHRPGSPQDGSTRGPPSRAPLFPAARPHAGHPRHQAQLAAAEQRPLFARQTPAGPLRVAGVRTGPRPRRRRRLHPEPPQRRYPGRDPEPRPRRRHAGPLHVPVARRSGSPPPQPGPRPGPPAPRRRSRRSLRPPRRL